MALEISTKNGKVSDSFIFEFDAEVISFIVGISEFELINSISGMQSNKGVKVKDLNVKVSAIKSGTNVTATVSANLSDGNHSLDSSSSCSLSCVAVTDESDPNINLYTVTANEFIGTAKTAPSSSSNAVAAISNLSINQSPRVVLEVTGMARVGRSASSLFVDGSAYISDGLRRAGSVDVGVVAIDPTSSKAGIGVIPATVSGEAGTYVMPGKVADSSPEHVSIMLQSFVVKSVNAYGVKRILAGGAIDSIVYNDSEDNTTIKVKPSIETTYIEAVPDGASSKTVELSNTDLALSRASFVVVAKK